jgi:acetyl-CoA acetyltransferase
MAYLVGIADTPVGIVPDLNATELYALAIRGAVADAGATVRDIDLLITGNSREHPFLYHAEAIAEYMGIQPERCVTVGTGGSTSITALALANAAVEAGDSKLAVIAKADSMASGLGRANAIADMATTSHPTWEHHHGPAIPSLYAMVATGYMHHYGITSEEIAAVSVSDRSWAHLNPAAQYRDEITVEDVVSSRLIADPLHLLDCSPVSDGGAAIAIAKDPRFHRDDRPKARIRGYANASSYEHISQAPSYTETVAGQTSKLALERAGRTLADIDVAMIYDAFSFMMCIDIEDIGFCKKGEGAAFVAAGETRMGGSLPTNTHGGVLSYAHPGRPSTMFLLTEAARQLFGECDQRQVPASTALVHASGGISSSHGTVIIERED